MSREHFGVLQIRSENDVFGKTLWDDLGDGNGRVRVPILQKRRLPVPTSGGVLRSGPPYPLVVKSIGLSSPIIN